jgi:Zn-dependent protease with chaperone function
MLLATGIIIISFLLLGQYRRILNIANYWKLIIGEDKRLYIRQPSIAYFKANNKWPTKLIVIIDYLLAFPINYAAFFISFEAMAYALFNKTIILEKSAILFSWIPASHMLFYNAINIESNLIRDILLIIPKLILIILSFPILFMTLRRIVNFVLDIKNEAYNYLSHISSIELIPPELSSFVKEITSKYNIRLPRLIIKNSKMIETNVKANIFKKRSTLVLSKGAIERLNINELKALVAHEMGHIRQSLRKLSLAKLLSRMSLSPNYILVLSFDFAEMEFDADRFCIEATKDKKAFRDALVKISIINTSPKEIPRKSALLLNKIFDKILTKRIRTTIENLLVSDEFYFGDVLVGYAHPTIMQRIKNIDSL